MASNGPTRPFTVTSDDRDLASEPLVALAPLKKLADAVLDEMGVKGPAELALTLVSVEQITELNSNYLAGTGPTDVLSFPLDDDNVDDGQVRLLGDVVICPEIAAANAPTHAGNLDDELALLCVHGILHVLGYDHAEAVEATIMREKESMLLKKFHRPVTVGTVIPT